MQAREALLQAPGSALPLLCISHRTAWFRRVVDEAEWHLRELLGLPDDFAVVFLQGGASMQFSMIPMSWLRGMSEPADYLVTGYWSAAAAREACREGPVNIVWNGEPHGYSRLPDDADLAFRPQAPYLHYVSNETVEGLQFHRHTGLDGVRRVCDMSSDFLSRPIDVSRFSLIYAHAQKNLGPAGVTVIVVRKDMLAEATSGLPAMLDYRRHVEAGSAYNTPPVFALYVVLLVLRWLRQDIGGLDRMARHNQAKAELLYGAIDSSGGFYAGLARAADRSLMNVVFDLPTEQLRREFLQQAEAAGFHGLQGHRSRGGVRASLYNAVTIRSVQALVDFMEEFRGSHGNQLRR